MEAAKQYRPPGWKPRPATWGRKSPQAAERCKRYRTPEWAVIRQRILIRDGYVCQLCGTICIGKGEAHVDHIVPVADGGSDDDDNLRTACVGCHGSRTLKDRRAAKGTGGVLHPRQSESEKPHA